MTLSERSLRGPNASTVVAAAELGWRAIQQHHPDLPDVVIVLGTGVERGRLVKLGHWWGARWEAAGEHRGEVLLAGEALHLPVEDVFEVLLHEAAHGLNAARGVKDTSRGGRYHNARFKATAAEVGLAVEQLPPYGWAKTSLSPAALERYAAEIETLRDAIRIARRIDQRSVGAGTNGPGDTTDRGGASEGPGRSGSIALSCGCGRRIRMAPSAAAQGAVLCGRCGSQFEPSVPGQRPATVGVTQVRPVVLIATPAEATTELTDRAHRWAIAHGAALDEPLLAASPAEAAELNRMARAERRALGQLAGPDLIAGWLALAAGDQVVVVDSPPALGLPDVGVVGQVVAASPDAGSVLVDFPIAGHFRIDATTAGRTLDHGYAATAPEVARPNPPELFTGPARATPRQHLAEVIELGLEVT
ncbi:MAG: hypothetical protein AB7O92_07920 [Acidimicrobiia bacterium]